MSSSFSNQPLSSPVSTSLNKQNNNMDCYLFGRDITVYRRVLSSVYIPQVSHHSARKC